MKHQCIAGSLLLAVSLSAYAESAAVPRIGGCAVLDSGTWITRGAQVFIDCLRLIQQQGSADSISIGRWHGVLIAQDGLGTLLSQDQGRSWQAYRGQAPEPAADPQPEVAVEAPARALSTEPWPPPTAEALAAANEGADAAADADVASNASAPAEAVPAAGLALELDHSVSSPAAATPAEAPPPEAIKNESASLDDPPAAAVTIPAIAIEAAAAEPPAASDAAPPSTSTTAPRTAAGAGDPVAPMEPSEHAQRAPDECRIRVEAGWIRSRAPSLKDCAKLLDQSPENYDAQGYKYAYWQDALLVATKFEVFTFDKAAQWTRVMPRYRY